MLTRDEFDLWFADYKSRWPSVGDYAARQQLPGALLDNWHASLAVFDLGLLEAVTAGIVSGRFDPVPNVNLGTWANEVRKMARQVLDDRRQDQDRRQQREVYGEKPFDPLRTGSMVAMWNACCAVYELVTAPDDDVVMAAICLADDHTPYERDRSLLALEGAGLTWDQVREVADRIGRNGRRPLLPDVTEAFQ